MHLLKATSLCYDSLLALIYPQACVLCGGGVETRHLGVVCETCWASTQLYEGGETLCWKCGIPSLGSVLPEKQDQVRCRRCDDDAFTAARAGGPYEGALRASVLQLKRQPHVSQKLLDLLVQTQKQGPLNQATLIVPVPLHPEREKARGFNQAALLGKELSLATSLAMDDVSLVRTHHTARHRAGMDARERKDTVSNAFTVRYPALICGEKILLVDDVFTTGATVSSCAKALLEAGAADVYVLTIARPLHN